MKKVKDINDKEILLKEKECLAPSIGQFVYDYSLDRVSEKERNAFDFHLERCLHCQETIEELIGVMFALSLIEDELEAVTSEIDSNQTPQLKTAMIAAREGDCL